jgi:hypothetical protein
MFDITTPWKGLDWWSWWDEFTRCCELNGFTDEAIATLHCQDYREYYEDYSSPAQALMEELSNAE